MLRFYQLFFVFFVFIALSGCLKTDPNTDLPDQKKTELGLYLTATEAHELVKKDPKKILFVDVRTPAEVSEGKPNLVDANVPIVEMRQNKVEFNNDFVPTIEDLLNNKGLDKQSQIVLICKQGNRSALATNTLAKEGHKNVYHVIDGFIGWEKSDLPWSK